MKKTLLFLLTLVIISLNCSFAYADDTPNNVQIINNKEITDINILYERAINNINDASTDEIEYIMKNTEIKINDKKQEYAPLITTQLISRKTDKNGVENNIYVANVISDIEIVTDDNGISTLSTRTHSIEETETSKGRDIKITTKVVYETSTYNKVNYIKLISVSANSALIDKSCKIPYTKVRGGYNGWNLETNAPVSYTSAWTTGTGFSASRTINGAKLEATPGGVLYSVWGEAYCQIKRGNQTWSFSMKVVEADSGSVI